MRNNGSNGKGRKFVARITEQQRRGLEMVMKENLINMIEGPEGYPADGYNKNLQYGCPHMMAVDSANGGKREIVDALDRRKANKQEVIELRIPGTDQVVKVNVYYYTCQACGSKEIMDILPPGDLTGIDVKEIFEFNQKIFRLASIAGMTEMGYRVMYGQEVRVPSMEKDSDGRPVAADTKIRTGQEFLDALVKSPEISLSRFSLIKQLMNLSDAYGIMASGAGSGSRSSRKPIGLGRALIKRQDSVWNRTDGSGYEQRRRRPGDSSLTSGYSSRR